ncbi:MAG: ankyrin repeat domain-containing protein [Bacillota bacterium]|jgi:ankyrin repeat protein
MIDKNKSKLFSVICVVLVSAMLMVGCADLLYEDLEAELISDLSAEEKFAYELIIAIVDGEEEQAKQMLADNNYDLNIAAPIIDGSIVLYTTPLHAACGMGYYELVQIMIEQGADVNFVTDRTNTSPLMATANNYNEKCVEVMKLLLAEGADANYYSEGEKNALYRVIAYVDIENTRTCEMIDLLEKAGVDIHQEYEEEGNILQIACNASMRSIGDDQLKIQAYLPIIKHLIEEKGFDVNMRKKDTGATPLVLVVLNDSCEPVVEYLLFHGADKSLKDNAGKTAYDYVKMNIEDGSVKYENPERLLELLK